MKNLGLSEQRKVEKKKYIFIENIMKSIVFFVQGKETGRGV